MYANSRHPDALSINIKRTSAGRIPENTAIKIFLVLFLTDDDYTFIYLKLKLRLTTSFLYLKIMRVVDTSMLIVILNNNI